MRRVFLILMILANTAALTLAQGGGQFCVRSFEDRNNNADYDASEPFITRGVSANLMDANGVIIATASLESSPTAAQGIMCFQRLEAGQYTVTVTSAAYAASTSNVFTQEIGSDVAVVDYGGRLIVAENTIVTTTNTTAQSSRTQVQGLLFGVIGAALVMGAMLVLGAFVYVLVFSKRLAAIRRQQYYMTSTGTMRPVNLEDTGQHRPV